MSNNPNDKTPSPNNPINNSSNKDNPPTLQQNTPLNKPHLNTSSTNSPFASFYFKNISEPELETHLKLVKQWLVKYNTFDCDNQSTSKLTALHLDDIKIILNHKKNFARIKLYVDFLELEQYCPNFALSLKRTFCKYYKYLNFLTKKILITSKKIKEDTSVFSDFILLNYPFIQNSLSQPFFVKLINKTKSGILSFSKCYVIKVNAPIYLLWCKKVYPKCSCPLHENEKSNEASFSTNNKYSNKKYFDIFKKNIKYNSIFNEPSVCPQCNKEYYHDTKSDIFIECQEIQLLIDSEEGFMNNVITVWAFGDLINSVKESDCISMNVFYIPEKVNCLEKNFSYGYSIVLNFNIYFIPLQLINVENFIWKVSNNSNNDNNNKKQNLLDTLFQRKSILNNENNLSDNNNINNLNIKNELKTIQFQRQLNNSFYKFIIQNYTFHKLNELSNCINSETSFPFLNIILDLSIAQRDYVNHLEKLNFLQNNNADYFLEHLNTQEQTENHIQLLFKTKTKIKGKLGTNIVQSNYEKSLTASRNLVFKTKLFANNNNKQQHIDNNRICAQQHSDISRNEFKKYFRLSKQITSSTSSISELLIKPLNVFIIFDSNSNDPMINQLNKYIDITLLNKSPLIMPYPVFTQRKIDKETLTNFYIRSKNKIVVINDIDMLSKHEIEFISNMITSLNNTFWFCCGSFRLNDYFIPHTGAKNGKNVYNTNNDNNVSQLKIRNFEKIMQHCEIVLNFSKRKAKTKFNIDIINETSINYFLNDMNKTYLTEQQILLWYNKCEILKEKINTKCTDNNNNTNNENNSNDGFVNPLASAKLIEDYFIAKRNIMKITFDDLFFLLRIAIFNSMLRCLYEQRKIVLSSMLSNINYIDSIFAIILYEEVCGYKYGFETKSFNSITDKIILRDYNEEINTILNNVQKIVKTKSHDDKVNMKGIPKSKTIKKMNFLDDNIDNFETNNISNTKEQCSLCKEIDNIKGGKDLLCELIDRLNNFTYEQFENEFAA